MLAINVNDLLTQIIAAVVAGILLLLIQPGWLRRSVPPASSGANSANSGNGGNQAAVQGNLVRGNLTVDQHYTDNSQTTTITNNVNNARGGSASEDDLGKFILVGIAGVIAAGLFALFQPLLQSVSYGLALAVVIMLVVAIHRTRQLGAWNARATIVTIVAGGSALVTWVVWWGISSTERDGISLAGIANEIGSPTAGQNARGVAGYFEFFIDSVIPVILDGDRPVAIFVALLAIGGSASAALTIFVWLRLLDWHAFLKFTSPGKRNERVVVRAKSFVSGRGYGIVIGTLLLAAMALSCALGYAFDLWHWASVPKLP